MSASTTVVQRTPDNPRGIPAAPFVSVVEEYIGGPNGDVDATLRKFQEMSAKYRYMELNQTQRKKGLLEKIPDIEKTLKVVDFLLERKTKADKKAAGEPSSDNEDEDDLDESSSSSDKPIKSLFELNDTLYAEAEIQETGDVYLWLGANVMLSYPLAEASALLAEKLVAAQLGLKNLIEDVEFLKEQITIMEVNTARVYNFDVKRRRERKELEAKEKEAGGLLRNERDEEEEDEEEKD